MELVLCICSTIRTKETMQSDKQLEIPQHTKGARPKCVM